MVKGNAAHETIYIMCNDEEFCVALPESEHLRYVEDGVYTWYVDGFVPVEGLTKRSVEVSESVVNLHLDMSEFHRLMSVVVLTLLWRICAIWMGR